MLLPAFRARVFPGGKDRSACRAGDRLRGRLEASVPVLRRQLRQDPLKQNVRPLDLVVHGNDEKRDQDRKDAPDEKEDHHKNKEPREPAIVCHDLPPFILRCAAFLLRLE